MEEDFATSPVPAELESVKNKVLKSIDLRKKAYDDLFMHYDLKEKSNYRTEADKKIAEANRLIDEVKGELTKYN